MSSYGYDEQASSRHNFIDSGLNSGPVQSLPPTTEGISHALPVLGGGGGASYLPSNNSFYASSMQMMQNIYGNQALQRYMGSAGEVSAYGGAGGGGGGMSIMGGAGPGVGMMSATAPSSGDPQKIMPGTWFTPGQTLEGGVPRPADGNGDYDFWNHTESNLRIPGGFNIPLHDYEGGFGVDIGGTPMFAGGYDFGGWQQDGGTQVGLRGNIGLVPNAVAKEEDFYGWFDTAADWVTWGLGMDDLTKVEAQAATLAGEASLGSDSFTFGGGGTSFGFAGTFGEFTNDPANAASTSEDTMRMGLSGGLSAGVRAHWSDSDGDGYNEWGFGFDAGPVTFDYQTEDPLRSIATGIASPFGPWASKASNYLLPEGNVTEMAYNAFDSAVMNGVPAAADWLGSWFEEPKQGLDPVAPPTSGGTGGLEGLFPSW
jgi:hypothetical protein